MKTFIIVILITIWPLALAAQNSNSGNLKEAGRVIRNDELISSTKIYPVPVKDGNITIESIKEIRSIRITNIIGQQIIRESYDYSPLSVKIEVGFPPAGIYLVNILFIDETRIVKKIVIE